MICASLVQGAVAVAQEREEQGKPIGKVIVVGKLILLELEKGASTH